MATANSGFKTASWKSVDMNEKSPQQDIERILHVI
jgi:hypothetical protein